MAKITTLNKFLKSPKLQSELLKSLKKGGIIIYPTDTIYGVGCDARFQKSTNRISKAKKRKSNQPFSIIVPSIKWIKTNTYLPKYAAKFLKKLPGPYTFILKAKPSIKKLASKGLIGIRIPKNRFCDFIRKNSILLITTSVNQSGQPPIQSIKELPSHFKKISEFVIDTGKLVKKPSTMVNLNGKRPKTIR